MAEHVSKMPEQVERLQTNMATSMNGFRDTTRAYIVQKTNQTPATRKRSYPTDFDDDENEGLAPGDLHRHRRRRLQSPPPPNSEDEQVHLLPLSDGSPSPAAETVDAAGEEVSMQSRDAVLHLDAAVDGHPVDNSNSDNTIAAGPAAASFFPAAGDMYLVEMIGEDGELGHYLATVLPYDVSIGFHPSPISVHHFREFFRSEDPNAFRPAQPIVESVTLNHQTAERVNWLIQPDCDCRAAGKAMFPVVLLDRSLQNLWLPIEDLKPFILNHPSVQLVDDEARLEGIQTLDSIRKTGLDSETLAFPLDENDSVYAHTPIHGIGDGGAGESPSDYYTPDTSASAAAEPTIEEEHAQNYTAAGDMPCIIRHEREESIASSVSSDFISHLDLSMIGCDTPLPSVEKGHDAIEDDRVTPDSEAFGSPLSDPIPDTESLHSMHPSSDVHDNNQQHAVDPRARQPLSLDFDADTFDQDEYNRLIADYWGVAGADVDPTTNADAGEEFQSAWLDSSGAESGNISPYWYYDDGIGNEASVPAGHDDDNNNEEAADPN